MADQKIIRKTYEAVETKAAEGEDRTLIVTISTINPDRSKDVVVPSGMEAKHYINSPVVAAFHDYHKPAIGKTVKLDVLDDRIVAKVQFLPKGIYPLADILYEEYKTGFMSAWSIGFIPKEVTDIDPENWRGGKRFDKWELLEYSAVLVPDNPEALTLLRSKGVDEKTIEAAQHIEAEVEASKVEKEIAAAAKQTEELEQKNDDQPATVEVGIKALVFDFEGNTYTLTYTIDGEEKQATEPLTDELKAQLQPPTPDTDPEALTKALSSIRDSLKPADKEIGLALRTLKTLLVKPAK